ncbi:hypothetical protein OLMES_2708 [Oleiphilus messinensis]|uniref:Uncharacterized protein n=1 Tax=Oleiphilus messinensis TaxID=141451 RepID=A0A1Y0I8D8_9GAMM|nr:ankyrin repeat domain-containing protein [Oleiphilus messinensis]ARU56758.1 hypothetical protein OLMES_2708 [Oleiphilus messinensis]
MKRKDIWCFILAAISSILVANADEFTALHKAIIDRTVAIEDAREIVRSRLESGDSPNVIVKHSSGVFITPLSSAVSRGDTSLVRLLLESGADPNIDLGTACTVLTRAMGDQNIEIIELLVKFQADTRVPTCGRSEYSTIHSIARLDSSNYKTKIKLMQHHKQLGGTLPNELLLHAILKKDVNLAKAFVDLEPEFNRDNKLLKAAKNVSHEIYNLLQQVWEGRSAN